MDIGLVYVSQGEMEFVFCFARNITERIQMLNALVESEETLRNTIHAMPDAVYIAAKWKFIYLNPAALQLFGASSLSDLAGESLRNRVRSEYHEIIRQRAQRMSRDRHLSPPREMVFIRLDGSEIDVETSAMPLRYQGNNVTLVCVRDISEKKRILRSLQECQEPKRQIIESVAGQDNKPDRED
jgi:PAS domain S-box-containing protein